MLLRVHGAVVKLAGVFDESGERGVDAEVDERFGVGLDDWREENQRLLG